MKFKTSLLLIILLATLFRGFDFPNNPPGLYVDEASLGYNAYSILLTGKDEYGKSLPIFFRSFGTYASSLYGYLSITPIKVLGLDALSIRLVSLISGVILVFIISKYLGLMEGLIVAISPVFVFFSRGAFEANLALTLFFIAVFLAIKAKEKNKLLPISFLAFAISAYAYQAERFLAPLMILFFTIYYWKKVSKRLLILSLTLAFLLELPILTVSLSPGANARLLGLNSGFDFIRLYIAYFSPNNLFSKPDPDLQRSFPLLSVFYWWMILPFIYGVWLIIKRLETLNLTERALLFVIFISPIPGAITHDYFSTLRVLPMFVGLSWIIATGLKRISNKQFLLAGLILLSTFELYQNLILLKHERSTVWNYEYKELAQFIKSESQPIIIDNSRQKPIYILLAFYNKSDPTKFQNQYNNDWVNNYYNHVKFENNQSIDNVEIRPIYFEKDIYKDTLIVADTLAISDEQALEHHLKLVKQIPDINGQTVLNIFQTNPKAKCLSEVSKSPSCP